jgi:hypothetical protein
MHIDIPGTVLVDFHDDTQKTRSSLGFHHHTLPRGAAKPKKRQELILGLNGRSPRLNRIPKLSPIGLCLCCRGSRWYRYSLGADGRGGVVGRSTCWDTMGWEEPSRPPQACRVVQTRAATWCSSFGLSGVEIHAAGGEGGR